MSYLKPQDVRLLCLLIANSRFIYKKQSEIAFELKVSPSTVNASLKRLYKVNLVNKESRTEYVPRSNERIFFPITYDPVRQNCREFLGKGIRYVFYDHPDILELAENTITFL